MTGWHEQTSEKPDPDPAAISMYARAYVSAAARTAAIATACTRIGPNKILYRFVVEDPATLSNRRLKKSIHGLSTIALK
jgi:hypothetical protein